MIDDSMTVLGTLADSVHEVMDIEPEKIEPAPKIGTRLNTDFIKGIGKRTRNAVLGMPLCRPDHPLTRKSEKPGCLTMTAASGLFCILYANVLSPNLSCRDIYQRNRIP